jgi:hypothetical protein
MFKCLSTFSAAAVIAASLGTPVFAQSSSGMSNDSMSHSTMAPGTMTHGSSMGNGSTMSHGDSMSHNTAGDNSMAHDTMSSPFDPMSHSTTPNAQQTTSCARRYAGGQMKSPNQRLPTGTFMWEPFV